MRMENNGTNWGAYRDRTELHGDLYVMASSNHDSLNVKFLDGHLDSDGEWVMGSEETGTITLVIGVLEDEDEPVVEVFPGLGEALVWLGTYLEPELVGRRLNGPIRQAA